MMNKKMMAMKMMGKEKPMLDYSKLKMGKMSKMDEMEEGKGFVSMMVTPEEKKMILEMRGEEEEEMEDDSMEEKIPMMKKGMKEY
jgi:hypothetical protein